MLSLELPLVLLGSAVWLFPFVCIHMPPLYPSQDLIENITVITVGTEDWLPDLIELAKGLKIGNGFEDNVDLGPVISPQSKAKIEALIAKGGKILLDGREPKAPEGYPDGNWVGPTVIEVEPGQEAYETEIFGPVLCIIKKNSLDDAINVINSNRCTFYSTLLVRKIN
jgi:malonate-semialdehyde dehydrogenase (acetylating)/methylmalonate-semialdehyde dehydrogenase